MNCSTYAVKTGSAIIGHRQWILLVLWKFHTLTLLCALAVLEWYASCCDLISHLSFLEDFWH